MNNTPEKNPLRALGRDNMFDIIKRCPNSAIDLKEAEQHVAGFLEALGIDWKNDPSMQGTPERVARMFKEVMHGRYDERPKMTEFPNTMKVDEMYCVGPVDIRSMCSHHLVPVIGKAWVGIILNKNTNILGLSKFARLADWVFARPHMQEEATKMLADEIEEICSPSGLALVVRCTHGCTVWRGVKAEQSKMVTSEMRGAFQNQQARAEFLDHIKGLGY